MTKKEKEQLIAILNPSDVKDKISARLKALRYLDTVQITEEPKSPRTGHQNNALWLFLGIFADKCVEMNISMRKIYEMTRQFDVPMTKDRAHDVWIWFQKNLFNTERTRDLKKVGQIELVHDVMMKNMGELFHMEYIPFPVDEKRHMEELSGEKIGSINNKSNQNYPEYTRAPTI